MQEHSIPVQINARYYTLGEVAFASNELWFVLHGYGQLASYFLPKFEMLSNRAYVIAPEGLSLFYLQGVNGRVGATWMTREFRETAIRNYVEYLSSIYYKIYDSHKPPKRTVLFAFSQGVSTLIRWVTQTNISFDEMIMWAGDFPTDIDAVHSRSIFTGKKLSYVYGDQDQFVTEKSFSKLQTTFEEYGVYPEIFQFSGKHEIPPKVLANFLQKERAV
uniref:Alpha/beta hydrolase n=1 Tax=Roseihalotalea indica TaxID=2867963 RepID=A0AA49GLF3_9BACT|nr:alpha/beta hydrolase [Tunicatimonas sp. TK19036]